MLFICGTATRENETLIEEEETGSADQYREVKNIKTEESH